MKKNIEPFMISRALSGLLVEMETQLNNNPDITLRKFVEGLSFDPRALLYSPGFSALIYFALIVPLKEALKKNKNAIEKHEWERPRRIRNELIHGTYTFNGHNLVVIEEYGHQLVLTPEEAVQLSSRLWELLSTGSTS